MAGKTKAGDGPALELSACIPDKKSAMALHLFRANTNTHTRTLSHSQSQSQSLSFSTPHPFFSPRHVVVRTPVGAGGCDWGVPSGRDVHAAARHGRQEPGQRRRGLFNTPPHACTPLVRLAHACHAPAAPICSFHVCPLPAHHVMPHSMHCHLTSPGLPANHPPFPPSAPSALLPGGVDSECRRKRRVCVCSCTAN